MSFSYVAKYDSSNLRGTDDPLTPRPWNLTNEILSYAGSQKKLLDIGCGTAFKLITLSPHFEEITGLDISEDMIRAATEILRNKKIINIKLTHGDSSQLPFDGNTYDVVTCMMSRWNINEIIRLLKPNGSVIIEHIGCEDKKDFKIIFGKDDQGWRGQFLDYQREEYLHSFYKMFSPHFNSVSIINGFWRTYYSDEGILELLKFTPTIRNFSVDSDSHLLEKALGLFKSAQGIMLTQNRILIHAKNIGFS